MISFYSRSHGVGARGARVLDRAAPLPRPSRLRQHERGCDPLDSRSAPADVRAQRGQVSSEVKFLSPAQGLAVSATLTASLAFLLCVLLSSLSVLAYASPPDPSWVRAVYDDADFDDIVCLILANTGLVDDSAPVEGHPDFVLIRAEVPQDELSIARFSLSSVQLRAPPTI